MNVLQLCGGYRAVYAGNFIPSLEAIEREIAPGKCVYAFHQSNSNLEWCQSLSSRSTVEYMDFSAPLLHRVKALVRIIKKHSIDVLHVHFGDKEAAMVCSHLLPKVKVIYHIHSDWSMGKSPSTSSGSPVAAVKKVLRKVVEYRVRRIAVSQHIAEQAGGVYIPNGIATERIHRRNDVAHMRSALGIASNCLLVLCFGWSPEVKGVDIAVDAINELRRRSEIDMHLAIVTGVNRDNVIKWIDTHTQCGSQAQFIHYLPPSEDVFAYHNMADIFLSSSRSEGFSYSICEAASIAKACVSSDIEGVQWAKAYPSIEFYDSGSIEACSEAIERVIQSIDDDQMSAVREQDASGVINEYNALKWAERVVDFYHDS